MAFLLGEQLVYIFKGLEFQRIAAAEVTYALPLDTDRVESLRKALTEALNLLPSEEMPHQ